MNMKLKTITSLFLTFAKIGVCTFGGGYAMIRLIEREVTQTRQWVTPQELLDIIAIAESTPGPIAINSATFIGYKMAGLAGAAAATIGVVLPSFVIICVISLFFNLYTRINWLRWAFEGIRGGVFVLILSAAVSFGRKCGRDTLSVVIFACSFLAAAFFGVSAIIIIAAAAIAGIARQLLMARGTKEGD